MNEKFQQYKSSTAKKQQKRETYNFIQKKLSKLVMKLSFYGIYRVFIVHDIHKRKRVFKICTLFTICFLCPKCNIQCIYIWYYDLQSIEYHV